MNSADAIAFIRANLPVVPVPSIPEVRLHKALPSSRLGRLAGSAKGCIGSPYWAYYWAGGLALARYILDRPETVAGRRVLDFGAGSGVVAIAAAKSGASHVIASEVDEYAVVALRLNIEQNGVVVSVTHADLTTGALPAVEIILVGDLFYDPILADRVTSFLDRYVEAGMPVLIGDPWRDHLPSSRLQLLAEYQVAEFGSAVPERSAVFAFQSRTHGVPN